MPTPTLVCRHASGTLTLAAGVATPVDIPIEGAANWQAILKNTGSNPITAATIATSPLGALFSPAVAFPTGIPLAADATLAIQGTAEPLTTVRLVLTSALGTTAEVEAGGR